MKRIHNIPLYIYHIFYLRLLVDIGNLPLYYNLKIWNLTGCNHMVYTLLYRYYGNGILCSVHSLYRLYYFYSQYNDHRCGDLSQPIIESQKHIRQQDCYSYKLNMEKTGVLKGNAIKNLFGELKGIIIYR